MHVLFKFASWLTCDLHVNVSFFASAIFSCSCSSRFSVSNCLYRLQSFSTPLGPVYNVHKNVFGRKYTICLTFCRLNWEVNFPLILLLVMYWNVKKNEGIRRQSTKTYICAASLILLQRFFRNKSRFLWLSLRFILVVVVSLIFTTTAVIVCLLSKQLIIETESHVSKTLNESKWINSLL